MNNTIDTYENKRYRLRAEITLTGKRFMVRVYDTDAKEYYTTMKMFNSQAVAVSSAKRMIGSN